MYTVETLVLNDGSVFPRYGKDPYCRTVQDHQKHDYFGTRKVAVVIDNGTAKTKTDARIIRERLRRGFKHLGIRVAKKG